ncbi:MAG: glycerophosphoryl diester phosphodiesterase membrane domain-containing protein [Candidatus Izimaplasma sp.]|nr:glycerophosphoryl diester phosphodiesterase membrane domain-containing protein [Candidatus Izimaplasma bacterium]
MKKTFKAIKELIFFDFKKLFIIELLIRLFGIFIIYPIFQIGLYLSIKISGLNYISNNNLIIYLTKPITILFILTIITVFAIYIFVEYVFLATFFDFAFHKQKLSYKQLVLLSFQKAVQLLKQYHVVIITPILFFFILLEYGQIILFSSTIKLPRNLTEQIKSLNYFSLYSSIFFFLLIIFFIQFIFMVHELIIRGGTIKKGYSSSRKILKSNHLNILFKFIFINLLFNLLMLLIYTGLIFIISLFISMLRGQEVVFGLIITSMYSVYWILALIFSIIILPLNIALIANHYYKHKNIKAINTEIKPNKTENLKWIAKPIIILFIVLFSLNIFSIIESVRNANSDIQFLKQEEIIAHRGASNEAPENTLAAINLAIDQGTNAVEFDIKGTKDHVPVLMHDDSIKRTTNSSSELLIKDLYYQDLLDYEAGSWFSNDFRGEVIPTLEEVLIAIKGRATGFIDLKTTDPLVEAEIIRLLAENDMIHDVKIMSFDINQLYRFKGYNEDIETILLLSSYYGNISTLFEDEYIDHFALRISVIKSNPNLINLIHNENKNAYAWVVDDRDAIYTGIEADVDGFITKRPIAAREIAYSKNSTDAFKRFLETLFKP